MQSGRKSPRFKIDSPAMIYDAKGNPIVGCTVRDVSATGAGLKLDKDLPLPKTFFLSLTRDASVRRRCEPVWQMSIVAGVRFVENL
jgi:hypothetical protein